MGRSPAVSAGDNTLHTREVTPRVGLEGPEGGPKRGTLSWLDVGGNRLGCHYIHTRAMHDQVKLESCREAG